MSLCPHQLVRPRLQALFSAPCRSPGRWQRSLRTPNTRHAFQYVSNHTSAASQPGGEGHTFADLTVEQLKSNREQPKGSDSDLNKRQNQNWRSGRTKSQRQFGRRNSIDQENETNQDTNTDSRNRQPTGRPQRRRNDTSPRLVSKRSVKRIMTSDGLNTRHATSVLHRLNNEIQREKRVLNKKSVALATSIRGRAIYSSKGMGLSTWHRAYEEIYKAKHYQREVNDMSVIPSLDKDGLAMLAKIQEDCNGQFREVWQASHRDVKAAQWQALAFWLLQNDPKLFLDFLVVTMKGKEKPDFTMVTDCLLYVDNFYYAELKNWETGPRSHSYSWMIEYCLRPSTWPIIAPPQKGIRLYIRRARPYGVRLAFRTMKARKIKWKAETQLCLVNRFTQLGDADRALSALKLVPRLKDPAFTMNSQGVLRHCCKLLTLDTVEDSEDGRNFRILPQLLEMGVRPDRDMMNVVLSNAFKTGDHQLGADMLQFMTSQDYTFDSYTYVTLLTDAVSRGDQARVHELINEVDAQEEIRKNPFVANKIFHSHYVFTAKHMDVDSDPSGVFYSMLDMYNKLHDITPLKELLIIPPHYKPQDEGPKSPPTPMALYIMIATYFRCRSRVSTVQRIYHRFHELVCQGHPTIAPLAATDHTYNEFLIALRKSSRALHSCVRIVEDMLHPPTGTAIEHTKPSYRTWAILLSVFIWHRRAAAAEKIKEMMAKHKVHYNDVTWNLIINGYANAQKVPETAAAMKAMEAEGYALDSYTMKSLRYLRDPERLWVAVDELDNATQEADTVHSSTPHRPAIIEDVLREELIEQGLQKLGDKKKSKA
ncbi:uncharacterized protein N7482_007536 [Penicillium canariense]|uniref:Pentatricopeptide repeat protein n=1 Tax=Penicillium canariense TaxID=189055 RepID=A0A9W9LJ88_9EURO|nr:uncharacterized protein N7482_007536 [Penicillium canariense]KAJ5160532.1 hypothetical protein N7482_007536 [Penicillium canariense]